MGGVIQQYKISQEKDIQKWLNELGKGGNMKRANWEVLDIMFGNDAYVGDNADVTPLYGVHVKGITE